MRKAVLAVSLTLMILVAPGVIYSQAAISDVVPNPNPDSTALLDLQSNQAGLLVPRMTTVERDNISNPAHSLMIFNTTTDCFEAYFTGGGWRSIECNCSSYPSAAFTVNPVSPSNGSPASFTPTYQGSGNYSWTFPNGSPSTSTSSNPSVTWASPDTVNVTLTVTDSNGCASTASQTVRITNCPPIGSNTVTFNNTSTGRAGTIQTWTVPAGVCNIQIEAWGAKGGGSLGGNGAYLKGEFSVTPGEVLNILVGQMGGVTSQGINYCAGGGGGTFVYRNATDPFPLMAAAGGGGQAEEGPCQVAGSGGVGSGTALTTNNNTTVTNGAGGTNGNGGSGGPDVPGAYSFSTGGGGCGWLTNGQDGLNLRNPPGIGGQAPRNGGIGGLFTHNSGYTGADGGFGGGGGGSDNTGAGGGGGGWNGGGGGGDYIGSCQWGAGGGGGSFNGGSNQVNQSGVRNTHGRVIITY